jgi:hypothetical protein
MIVVDVKDLHVHPDLDPKRDDHLLELMRDALVGAVPLYHAAIPLSVVVPFDSDYDPSRHPAGEAAIKQTCSEWAEGRFSHLVVYQRGPWFIVADDYIPLFAAIRGQPDCVPCWVLGKPKGDLPRDVQGPIRKDEAKRCLGME